MTAGLTAPAARTGPSDWLVRQATQSAPLLALLDQAEDGVLAVITGIDGPSYRPLGAMMAIFPSGARAGMLSSGCIEADIAVHAAEVLDAGWPISLRYGRGSPFLDIRLPCGGGLEILLLPRPCRRVIEQLVADLAVRRPTALGIDPHSGAVCVTAAGETGFDGATFRVSLMPDIAFQIFGKGPEATTLAAMVRSSHYPHCLFSPDEETVEIAAAAGCDTRLITSPDIPSDMAPDARCAVVLFFHDHDWEPPILKAALASPAFYIGALGSRRARDSRIAALRALGVEQSGLDRLRGPVGLIPSTRDPRTLAVSILAEILAVDQDREGS